MYAIIRTYDGRNASYVQESGSALVARNANELWKLRMLKSSLEVQTEAVLTVVELPDDWPFDTVAVTCYSQVA